MTAALEGVPKALEEAKKKVEAEARALEPTEDTVMQTESDEEENQNRSHVKKGSIDGMDATSAVQVAEPRSWAATVQGKASSACNAVASLVTGSRKKKQKEYDAQVQASCQRHVELMIVHCPDVAEKFIDTELGAMCTQAAAYRKHKPLFEKAGNEFKRTKSGVRRVLFVLVPLPHPASGSATHHSGILCTRAFVYTTAYLCTLYGEGVIPFAPASFSQLATLLLCSAGAAQETGEAGAPEGQGG